MTIAVALKVFRHQLYFAGEHNFYEKNSLNNNNSEMWTTGIIGHLTVLNGTCETECFELKKRKEKLMNKLKFLP